MSSDHGSTNYGFKIPKNDHIDMALLEKAPKTGGHQRQKRRNVMTKSLNTKQERELQAKTLEDNIEAGKYVTEKDILLDKKREEELREL